MEAHLSQGWRWAGAGGIFPPGCLAGIHGDGFVLPARHAIQQESRGRVLGLLCVKSCSRGLRGCSRCKHLFFLCGHVVVVGFCRSAKCVKLRDVGSCTVGMVMLVGTEQVLGLLLK